MTDETKKYVGHLCFTCVGCEMEPEHSAVVECASYIKRDDVNHPTHYTSHPSGIECIDIVKYHDFCTGSAMKYLWRAGIKQEQGKDKTQKEIEDLRKAVWYIEQKIKDLEGLENEY